MRLLFVTQRYGAEVFGGAEVFCREYATRLAAAGHEVEVLTSCAVSYVDWADHYPAGTTEVDGVPVHRLPVARPRDNDLFNPLNVRVNAGLRPTPLYLQRAWMDLQGPRLPALPGWIEAHAGDFDVAVFFTYLYWSTWAGLPAASGLLPTVLHPTAHDEPPLYLQVFDQVFHQPAGFGFLTPEEAALVERRFRVRRPSITSGVGIELTDAELAASGSAFRARHGLGDAPYLLYLGRLDPHKGTVELHSFFTAYKARHPGPLKLVVVGQAVHPLPPHDDVVLTGWDDEAEKHEALAGATALVHPSYFESFSLVLGEAWAHGKPALVQGRCDVLDGQVRRSGGGLPYRGFGEFEAALELLESDERLRRRLGAAGRSYVEATYRWADVLGGYERFLERLAV
jgi:glycosyltransferase involved in cell wall biosynthesis